MNAPRVTIVILTFNSQHIIACLQSLAASTYPCQDVVIVDNGSTNDALDQVRAQFPNTTIIVNDANLGYAQGNNVGLQYALERGADFVLVLNDDVEIAPDMIAVLVDAAQAQPNAAMLGPLVYHHSMPDTIQSAGGGQTETWEFFHRGQNQRDVGQFAPVESVAWLTGCAIMVRAQSLHSFGLLDPDYFMYWEETDWCLRARRAGFQVLFVPHAKLWHKGVQMDYQPSPTVTYYSTRNELLFLLKQRAGIVALTRAVARHARTIASYTVRPRWRSRRAWRDAHARGLSDFLRGQRGRASGM